MDRRGGVGLAGQTIKLYCDVLLLEQSGVEDS